MKPLQKNTVKALSLFLAMAVVVVSCFPIENYFASSIQNNPSAGITYSKIFDFTDTQYPYNSNLPIPPITEDSHPSGHPYTYWYNLYDKQLLFSSAGDVYAYRISVTVSDVSITQSGIQSLCFCWGDDTNFSTLDSMNVGISVQQSGVADYWFVNDYAHRNVYIGALAMYGNQVATPSHIDYYSKVDIVVTPYRMNDMVDEIYSQLLTMTQGQTDIYNELVKLYSACDTLESKLSTLNSHIVTIKANTGTMLTRLKNIEDTLSAMQTTLDNIYVEEQKQSSWLGKIWEQIQTMLFPNSSDKEQTDNFTESTSEKSETLNNLNSQIESVDKPTAGDVSNYVDNITVSNDNSFSMIFDVFFENEFIMRIIMMSATFMLVAYVFFGKRG